MTNAPFGPLSQSPLSHSPLRPLSPSPRLFGPVPTFNLPQQKILDVAEPVGVYVRCLDKNISTRGRASTRSPRSS